MAERDIKPADKITDPNKIDLDAAKGLVERDAAASKDGVAPTETDALSGIVMRAGEPDKSVRTYDPQNVEREKPADAVRNKKYESGEPVSDRS